MGTPAIGEGGLLDRIDQDPTDLGTIFGSVDIDMNKSNIYATLGGDVSSVTLINGPDATKYTTAVITITQDASTARSMDWSGSGVYSDDGLTATDLEPFQTLSSITQYWLYWAGHLGYWTISKVEISTSAS